MAITYHAGRRIQGIAGVDVADTHTSTATPSGTYPITLGGGSGSGATRCGLEVHTGHFLIDKGLKTIKFNMDRYGSVSGTGHAQVYDSSGNTKGSTSSTYSLSGLPAYPVSTNGVTFTWTTPVVIADGDRIMVEGGSFNTSNQVDFYGVNTTPDSNINPIGYNSGTWTAQSGADTYFVATTETNNGDTKPTNVQAGSRYEETDTRKVYHYEPQVGDYDYPMTTDPRTNTFNSSLCTITHANSTLQMNQITNGGAGGSATYIDLLSALSTKWVMRFKTKQTAYTSYAGNSQFQVGMSSVAPTSTAYQISSSLNWIGIRWYFGTQIWSGGSRVGVEPRINQNAGDNDHNNSTWNGGGGDQRLYGSPREVSDTTTPYYHEIIWNVDTFTYNLYDNENYTGTKLATATMSSSTNTQWVNGTPSSISGLQYLVFKMGGDSSMGVWVNQLDDVEIWDGVTVAATGNAWSEEGT